MQQMEPPSLSFGTKTFQEVEAEYFPVSILKKLAVIKAHSRALGVNVIVKCISAQFMGSITPGIPDEITLSYALERLDPSALGDHAFARPMAAFRAPVSLHPLEPRFLPCRNANAFLVMRDEGVSLPSLLRDSSTPMDPLRIRWFVAHVLKLLLGAYSAIQFTHHDMHSGNIMFQHQRSSSSSSHDQTNNSINTTTTSDHSISFMDVDVSSADNPLNGCCCEGKVRLIDFGTSDACALSKNRNKSQLMIKTALKRLHFDIRCLGVIFANIGFRYQFKNRFEKDPDGLFNCLFVPSYRQHANVDPEQNLQTFRTQTVLPHDPTGELSVQFLHQLLLVNVPGNPDPDISVYDRYQYLMSHPYLAEGPQRTHVHQFPKLLSQRPRRMSIRRRSRLQQELQQMQKLLLEAENDEQTDRQTLSQTLLEKHASWVDLALVGINECWGRHGLRRCEEAERNQLVQDCQCFGQYLNVMASSSNNNPTSTPATSSSIVKADDACWNVIDDMARTGVVDMQQLSNLSSILNESVLSLWSDVTALHQGANKELWKQDRLYQNFRKALQRLELMAKQHLSSAAGNAVATRPPEKGKAARAPLGRVKPNAKHRTQQQQQPPDPELAQKENSYFKHINKYFASIEKIQL